MAINLETALTNGLLSELAYLELENYTDSLTNLEELKKFIDGTVNKDGENDGKGLSGIELERKEIIKSLLDKYEIVKFASDDKTLESDFQGMLLKDKVSGEYIVSFRGTAGLTDAFVDIASGTLNINAQYNEAKSFVESILSELKLEEKDLTLIGHSLGGILTQQVGATLGIKGYAYNPWGASTLVTYPVGKPFQMTLIERIFGVIGITDPKIINFAKENILNVSLQDAGLINGDILSNFATGIISEHLGEFLPLFYKDVDLGAGHSIITMNKVLGEYNQILSHFIQETTYFELSNAYLLTSKYINGGYDYVQKKFTELDIYSKTQLQLNILENINYEDIVNSNDKAKLYSLINQIPFTISSSSVDLYENFDISNMSESELNDRGLMYQYIINNTPEEQREYIFMNYETKINLMDNSLKKPAIVFGNETSEVLYGKDTDDRIYAGKGDDKVIAGNGNDYVEGGLGNDTIEAGAGINYIDGGTGSDTISYRNIINSNKEGITLNLSLATAQAINSTTTDTLVNIENVIGSRYADNITAKDNSTTTLNGGFGNDTLKGGNNSENMLLGEDGDDYIYGGTTTDEIMLNANKLVMNYLDGGNGKDYLIAGRNANNYLFAGAGNDTLVSTLIGFKNESAGIDYSKGSSYLNGGEGIDTYVVKDYVTIEDDDGLGEIQTKYGKLQDLTIKTLSDGTILLLKNNPIYVDATTTSNPFAGYTSGAFNTALGNFGTTTTQGMSLDNYELVFKLQKDGNDLILNDLTSNPTVIRIKNYTANSLNLNITQDMLDNLPSLNENQTPSPTNPTLIGTNEIDTLIGSEVNNTFISNAGNDTLKDITGGNDIYKFKKGDGADIIYDIKGNDTIIFDESVLKSDVTFSQSDDLKSLIINYSPTDSITITNYFFLVPKLQLGNAYKNQIK